MKITGVRCYPINFEVNPEFRIKTTLGLHAHSNYLLLALETDDGLVGWGEASVVPIWSGEIQAGALNLMRNYFTPLLLGRDPIDVAAIMAQIDVAVIGNGFTKAAVEMALLDLIGKALDQPLYQHLGGRVNPPSIPIKFSIGLRSPEDAAHIAAGKVAEGFSAIKVKVGPDLTQDLARVQTVREAIGPDIQLTIDVNGGWGVKESIRNIPQFEQFGLAYIEQPTAREDIEGLAEVRRAVNTPIMADESVFTLEHALKVIRIGAADLISVYPGKNGGILKAQLICHMAEIAGIGCHLGSNLEWDVATAAMCHLAVATANLRVTQYPVDILGPLYYETRPNQGGIHFAGGRVELPTGPGLGLRLDEGEIEELSKSGDLVASH